MPNFSSNWLITSTGIAAPPDTPSRRTDAIALRSWRSAAPGRFSSVMYIVGTPAKIVTLCACIALNTASGSKRGSSTIDAPAIRRGVHLYRLAKAVEERQHDQMHVVRRLAHDRVRWP